MSARRTRRALTALAALCLAAGAVGAPSAEITDAAFVDSEYASATVGTTSVPRPQHTAACTASNDVLGANPVVRVYWRVPEGMTAYDLDDVEFARTTGGVLLPITGALLGNIQTTGTPAGYTTVISGGLLGGLLGGTEEFGVRFVTPGEWRSGWLVATATLPALGGNGTCQISYPA